MRAGLALLSLLTLLAFSPVLRAGFISFDDPAFVSGNPNLQGPLTPAALRWALTSTENANWFPLTRVSQLLDVGLFGLDARGHHLTNLLLHIASTVLLAVLLARLTGRAGCSLLVAALFALHPLHVESVAWVTERSDVLAGLFWMLTLAAYARYVRRPAAPRYAVVVLVYGLGLMAKATLVPLPLVLLALDYWPLGRFGAPMPPGSRPPAAATASLVRPLVEKMPLLLLAAAASLLTFGAQAGGGAVGLASPFTLRQTLAVTLPQVPLGYLTYLGKTLWPARLAIFYPHPTHGISASQVVLASVALAAISLGVLLLRRRHPWLLAGWAWYLVALLPMSGLIQVGSQAVADRYTYLPLTGVFLAAVWLAADAARRLRAPVAAVAAAAVVLVALLSVLSYRQARLWQDDRTLFEHTLAVTGPNAVAEAILGQHFLDDGDAAAAARHFGASLELRPRHPGTLFGAGLALNSLGRRGEAIARFEELAAVQPANFTARFNLGALLLAQGRFSDAQAQLQQALALDPGNPVVLEQLARCRRVESNP